MTGQAETVSTVAEEPAADTAEESDATPEPEAPKRVIGREDLKGVKQNPRQTIRRALIDVPEWGEGAQVWGHGVSELERQVADQYAAPEGKRDMIRYMEAMIAASLRESEADNAAPLFDVPGPDNGKLAAMGYALFHRLFNEVTKLDLGEGLAAQVIAALEDFRKAEETKS